MENKKSTFEERINTLRKELTDSIVAILKENKLTKLSLSNHCDHVTYIVWFDDNSIGYDSRVIEVALDRDGFSIEALDDESGQSQTLCTTYFDIGCRNLDWLNDLRESILFTLEENDKMIHTACLNCGKEYHLNEDDISYDTLGAHFYCTECDSSFDV